MPYGLRFAEDTCEDIPTQNLYAVTQHLLTRRNFLFLNSLKGFWVSLGEISQFHDKFDFNQ